MRRCPRGVERELGRKAVVLSHPNVVLDAAGALRVTACPAIQWHVHLKKLPRLDIGHFGDEAVTVDARALEH